jgi:hypothetical protein
VIGLLILRAGVVAMFVTTVAATVAIPMVVWDVDVSRAAGIGVLTGLAGILGFLFAAVDYALDQRRDPTWKS